jgi:hypothetical protein
MDEVNAIEHRNHSIHGRDIGRNLTWRACSGGKKVLWARMHATIRRMNPIGDGMNAIHGRIECHRASHSLDPWT